MEENDFNSSSSSSKENCKPEVNDEQPAKISIQERMKLLTSNINKTTIEEPIKLQRRNLIRFQTQVCSFYNCLIPFL